MKEKISRRGVLRTGLVATAAGGAAAVVAEPAAAAVAGDGWISVLDHGAVGDGVTDDTTAIRAAFRAAIAGATPVYFPPRAYRVSDELLVLGLTDAVISGHGATLVLAGAARAVEGDKSVLHLRSCQRVTVLGLSIRDTERTQQYNGVRISRSTGVTLDGLEVYDIVWNGLGVYDDPKTNDSPTSVVEITNCTVQGSKFGISSNGDDVRISDNHVATTGLDGIMVLSGSDRVVVANNTMTDCGAAGVYTQACTNLVVSGNTVRGSRERGIELDGGRGGADPNGVARSAAIIGNVVVDCFGQINLVQARDVTVVGNRVESSNPAVGSSCISINLGTDRVMVTGNQAVQAHATFPAIFVHERAVDVTVAWNSVLGANPYQTPASTVLMYRSGPSVVKTDGKLIAVGGIGVGNSQAASTPGQVVRKIEVFSSTGASLGWIPVYNTIS